MMLISVEVQTLRSKLFSYINNRLEEDHVLVDADEVYQAFAIQFDNGYPVEVIDEVIKDVASVSDLTGIQIQYEGEILLPLNM